jgi:aryl-alcohol dehydrogenase-like predicted oxidoreductase
MRTLGKSGIEVSALGLGTWAMGGPFWAGDQPCGWGPSDDAESVRALRHALELGVTLYDTSDAYGTGHAEELLGATFGGVRDQVQFATKWGNTIDSSTRQLTGEDPSPAYQRRALTESLRRLRTDYVDVYQLHLSGLNVPQAVELRAACEDLVAEGLIRTYGWSTDDPERAAVFAEGDQCGVVQCEANVLRDRPDMYKVADEFDVAVLCRGPLAMGVLTGRDWSTAVLPSDDIRSQAPEWLAFFSDGRPAPSFAAKRDAVRDVLTSGGRSLAQGALAWLWARSPRAVPIPGGRTVAQVSDNAGALDLGPLTVADLAAIDGILSSGSG